MTAREKFFRAAPPRTKRLKKGFAGVPAGSHLHISSPAALAEAIGKVTMGQTMSVRELRESVAVQQQADATCPVTTAMYLRIITEIAMEDLFRGVDVDEVTPFWRVITPHDPIAKRVPGAPEMISTLRQVEAGRATQ
ncbi:hypothetical protein FBY40_0158 [Microbacterium sp. SLBN-154]|nr:hypothetical protein FBY40_0158 [Microbacterium sp. SLBN-154]